MSCDIPTESTQSNPSSFYYVDDADHLYFKNMRAYYYENEKGPGEGIDYYKFRKMPKAKDRPILQPTITDYWIKDEAYLTVGTNDYQAGFADPLTILAVQAGDTSTIALANQRPQTQTDFHLAVRKALDQDADLLVRTADQSLVFILRDQDDKMAFGTILKDYQKMVAKN